MDKAFVKGIRLIEALAQSPSPRRITDLATELQITKSNVHRLLATLQKLGYAKQIPATSNYELTTRIWELGSHVIRRMDLCTAARSAMTRLAETTGETVHLSILDDTEVVYIDKIESSHHIRAHTSVGSRAPAWAVATGKAMLAQMPDQYLLRIDGLLQPFTATARTSLEALRADIMLIRAQGYCAVYSGEWRDGIAAAAAAILDGTGDMVGAIGISGPDSRLQRPQVEAAAAEVIAAAHEIGKALGHSGRK